jgi:hypothetical protein
MDEIKGEPFDVCDVGYECEVENPCRLWFMSDERMVFVKNLPITDDEQTEQNRTAALANKIQSLRSTHRYHRPFSKIGRFSESHREICHDIGRISRN